MRRANFKTWIVFTICFIVTSCALDWISGRLLHFEQAQQNNAARERLRDNLRLAVWRLDSLVGPVIAEEAVRPPFHYKHFYPYDSDFNPTKNSAKGESESLKISKVTSRNPVT